jgi:hypothetical protein
VRLRHKLLAAIFTERYKYVNLIRTDGTVEDRDTTLASGEKGEGVRVRRAKPRFMYVTSPDVRVERRYAV